MQYQRSIHLYVSSLHSYLQDNITERDNCIVPKQLWQRWVDDQETEVLLVELKQGTFQCILCVESYHNNDRDTIYIPERYLGKIDQIDHVDIRVLDEMPPKATKIVLEPLDEVYYSFDIATATSEYLSHWNIMAKDTTLKVPCLEIPGYTMDILVKDVEPSSNTNYVLLRDEVPLDISEVHREDYVPRLPTRKADTPMPSFSGEMDFDSMIPMTTTNTAQKAFSGKGHRLGS